MSRPAPGRRRPAAGPRPRPPAEPYLIPGRQPVREALRAGRTLQQVVLDRRGGDVLEALGEQARARRVDVRVATREEMDAITGEVQHQGVFAVAERFEFTPLAHLLNADLVVVLDGITDARNLGAIARVAEQAGAGGMVIRDKRAAGPSPAAEKASAGALSWLPVAQVTNISAAMQTLSDAGLWTIGLSGGAAASIWDHALLSERVAIVIGEEGGGLSRLVAERADALVTIPMAGRLDSLNAGTAAAIATFEWRRRHGGRPSTLPPEL